MTLFEKIRNAVIILACIVVFGGFIYTIALIPPPTSEKAAIENNTLIVACINKGGIPRIDRSMIYYYRGCDFPPPGFSISKD